MTIKIDSLLQCLTFVAKKMHIPHSETQLVSGLPLVDGRLTPELFVRAASRINLTAKIERRNVDSLPNAVLPAILMLEDNHCIVILKKHSQNNHIEYFDPLDCQTKTMSAQRLDALSIHMVVLIKSDQTYDDRALETQKLAQKHWFWSTIQHSWRIYRDVILASLLINIFALANPLFVMNVYDRVVPNSAIETLWVLAIGIIIVYLFDYLLKTLRVYFIELASKKSDILLSSTIYERVLGTRYDKYPASVGAFAGQLRDFESIRNFITSSSLVTFVDLPFAVLFLIIIGYIGGAIVWVPVIIIPLILLFAYIVQRRLNEAVTHMYTAASQKNATMIEALSSLSALKVLNAQGRALKSLEKAVGQLALWGLKSRMLSNAATTFAGFMLQMSSVLVVIVGVYLIALGELTMGGLIACVLLTARALQPFSQVAGLLVQFKQSAISLESLTEIVQQEQERPNNKHFISRKSIKGDIAFKDVDFTYPGDDHPTLKGISFTVKQGEKVALVGRIGSGKSTIHNLISGLYTPKAGAILIDGVDAKQLDPVQLRDNIGYAQQDGALFYGSIQENIAYRDTFVDDEEILRVCDIAGVSEFTNTHPHGLSRMVAERGINLSGGQRQSVIVARSLVNSPSILLLDEPSSAMDNASESRLLSHLSSEIKDRTVVLVTHKTSLLAMVDRIIVLDQGGVVADGPKASVLDALKKGQIRVG